jgi:SAM-dependent methyltransferase
MRLLDAPSCCAASVVPGRHCGLGAANAAAVLRAQRTNRLWLSAFLRWSLGTRVADSRSVALPLLGFDATAELRDSRHTLELLLLDQVRIDGWDRVLFIECGDGWVVEEACRRMGKGYVCGLSLSPELVDVAVQLRGVPGRIEFGTWSGEELPLSDRSFDRVIVCAPWDVYQQPPVVLTEVARVLRLGGGAYLLTPGAPSATFYRALADAGLTELPSSACENGPARCPGSASPVLIHVRHRATS